MRLDWLGAKSDFGPAATQSKRMHRLMWRLELYENIVKRIDKAPGGN